MVQPLDPLQPVAPPIPPQRRPGRGQAPIPDRDEDSPEESSEEAIEDEGYSKRPRDDDGQHIDEYA